MTATLPAADFFRRLCFIALLMLLPLGLYGQTVTKTDGFIFHNWTISDGLPVNSVKNISQGPNGFLWVTTYDGITRFDGSSFYVFNTSTYPELPSNRFTDAVPAHDGSIWILTERFQLLHYINGKMYPVTELDGVPISFVTEITAHKDKTFITTDNGAFVYEKTSGDSYELRSVNRNVVKGLIKDIYPDENGNIWFNEADKQVKRWNTQSDRPTDITDKDSLKFYLPVYYRKLSPDSLYLSVDGKNLIYRPSTTSFDTIPAVASPAYENDDHFGAFFDLGKNHHNELLGITPSGNVYQLDKPRQKWNLLNSEESISRQSNTYTFKSIHVIDESTTLIFAGRRVWKNNRLIHTFPSLITTVFADKNKNIWVGTRKSGLFRIKKNYFSTIGSVEGLPTNNISSLWYEDENQMLLAGLYGYGFAAVDDRTKEGRFYQLKNAPGTFALVAPNYPEVIVGVEGGGVFTYHIGRDDDFSMMPGSASLNNVRTIYPSGDSLLIGSEKEFSSYSTSGNFSRPVKRPDSLATLNPRYIATAPDSSLWMANFDGGLVQYQPQTNSYHFYSGENLQTNQIRSLYILPTQSPQSYDLFLGTEDVGLIRVPFSNKTLKIEREVRYTTSAGMPDYVIHSIYPDAFNHLWMSTNRGLFRVSLSQLNSYRDGLSGRISGVTYMEQDGLLNREFNGGYQSPVAFSPDGRVFMSSQAGIVSFNPQEIHASEDKTESRAHITRISTSDTVYHHITEQFKLPKDQRTFQIHFSVPDLTDGVKSEYRYKISGYLEEWQYIDHRKQIPITNLDHGVYDIFVQVSGNNGEWTGASPVTNLTIEPYFYETMWFRILLMILAAGGIIAVIRWRTNVLEERKRELEIEVDRRTEELKTEQEKTKKQADQLKELDRYKTRFFTNISHELRTPLTLIQSPLKQLLKEKADHFDASTLTTFKRMEKNGERLKRLIDQTLDLAKSEQGKLKLRAQEIDIAWHVRELGDLYKPLAEEKEIDYEIRGVDKPVHTYADVDKLDGIISNLLSNALKFTPKQGRVSIKLVEHDQEVCITVTDTGIGMTNDDAKNVFKRFYQVDSSETRSFEGSGIGLYISNTFARLHNGKLDVSSEKGSGSEFTLTLPKGRSHLDDAQILDHVNQSSDTSTSEEKKIITNGHTANNSDALTTEKSATDRKHLMIVEDNEDLLEFLTELFEVDYEVSGFNNGNKALSAVKQIMPDLIISDIMMPEMDGYTLNANLKEHSETAGIPLIFLTAKSGRNHQLKGYQEGGDAYISKPFDPSLLKARVVNLIDSRKRLRSLLQSEANTIGESTETASIEKQKTESRFKTELNEIMESHYMDPDFNVNELSRKLHLDRSQVLRKIKEECETTPTNYIKSYRMEKARTLMSEKSGNISEIAYAVGYNSLSYFSRVFKEHFNESPSSFVNDRD